MRSGNHQLRLLLKALTISLMSSDATATPSGIIQKPRTGRIPNAPAMINSTPTGSLRPLGTCFRMRRNHNRVIIRSFLAEGLVFVIAVGLQFLITLGKPITIANVTLRANVATSSCNQSARRQSCSQRRRVFVTEALVRFLFEFRRQPLGPSIFLPNTMNFVG